MTFKLEDHPHKRYNPLTGEWVLVSPHRAKRPWQGQVEKTQSEKRAEYEPKCYLCPGNERAGGIKNENYKNTYVFKNDFSALLLDSPDGKIEENELFRAEAEKGICKVICFSPRHDLTIPEMSIKEVKNVIDTWQKEYIEIGSNEIIKYVQIFENKGAVMGCSNPHPHGQIWASSNIPGEPTKKDIKQKEYFERTGKSLLEIYVKQELEKKERIIFENEHFVALVPFWAIWPFEAMIVSKKHITDIAQLNEQEKESFAKAYHLLTIKYDNLFETSFPYSAGLHQKPTDNKNYSHWHLHMSFYPPLLRSATVKKFMVGYEMLGNPQRDITAETAARRLRELPDKRY